MEVLSQGDLLAASLHGKGFARAIRRALYGAANQAAKAVSAAFATTYTGLCLSNPKNSVFNLVLGRVGFALSAAPAAIAPIGIMAGYNASTNVTHTTAVTPKNRFFGVGSAGVGLVDEAATLPTAPVLVAPFMGGFTAAALPASGLTIVDMEGGLILPPGAYACIYALTTVTGLFSFEWEEVPI